MTDRRHEQAHQAVWPGTDAGGGGSGLLATDGSGGGGPAGPAASPGAPPTAGNSLPCCTHVFTQFGGGFTPCWWYISASKHLLQTRGRFSASTPGMFIRCLVHFPQKMPPQLRQWCFRLVVVNFFEQPMQSLVDLSGAHCSLKRALCMSLSVCILRTMPKLWPTTPPAAAPTPAPITAPGITRPPAAEPMIPPTTAPPTAPAPPPTPGRRTFLAVLAVLPIVLTACFVFSWATSACSSACSTCSI
mmetsp:Transcript_4477/g.15726  ORF Transcript_4477/g.15726 Transcript_4477/m.15726 type:complete len:245 (+) Transcript_4477:119-853(+)